MLWSRHSTLVPRQSSSCITAIAECLSIRYTERLAEAGIEPIGNIPPAEYEEMYYR
jgi:hypothetical protein